MDISLLSYYIADNDEVLSIDEDRSFENGKYLTYEGIDTIEKEFDLTFITATKTLNADMSFIFKNDKVICFVSYKMVGSTPNIFVEYCDLYTENGSSYTYALRGLVDFESLTEEELASKESMLHVPRHYLQLVAHKLGYLFNVDNQKYEKPVVL